VPILLWEACRRADVARFVHVSSAAVQGDREIPEPGPASLPGVYARALAAGGHDVRVLTGFSNYPTGRLYPGYKGRFPLMEVRDGLPVRRLPLFPNHGGSAVGRVM
jgi:colanic acid biosynthesis glycosyl transferase WcaI